MSKVITVGKHTCQSCGRILGVGFYYACHVCGATFCYAHAPEKCDHKRKQLVEA